MQRQSKKRTKIDSLPTKLLGLVVAISMSFLISCDNEKTEVSGTLPQEPITNRESPVNTPPETPALHIYSGAFQVVNSGAYKTLLETCSRCGTKRITQTPFGTRYERHWSLGESTKACDNWLSEGFIQLDFAENRLPTSVKVLFQPKYRGSVDQWGWPFELTAEARPINQSQGFEIVIPPNSALGGLYPLILSSTTSNHVTHTDLTISVSYGATNQSQIIMEPRLKKYTDRAVETPELSCREYPVF